MFMCANCVTQKERFYVKLCDDNFAFYRTFFKVNLQNLLNNEQTQWNLLKNVLVQKSYVKSSLMDLELFTAVIMVSLCKGKCTKIAKMLVSYDIIKMTKSK